MLTVEKLLGQTLLAVIVAVGGFCTVTITEIGEVGGQPGFETCKVTVFMPAELQDKGKGPAVTGGAILQPSQFQL
jgi:hypothetical protein